MKTPFRMKRRRYSLPGEQPLAPAEVAARLRTSWPLPLLLAIPPVAGYLWRGMNLGDWGWGVIGLAVSAAVIWILWHGLAARSTECNLGVFDRFQRPVRYWLMMSVLLAGYALIIATFFFAPMHPGR